MGLKSVFLLILLPLVSASLIPQSSVTTVSPNKKFKLNIGFYTKNLADESCQKTWLPSGRA